LSHIIDLEEWRVIRKQRETADREMNGRTTSRVNSTAFPAECRAPSSHQQVIVIESMGVGGQQVEWML
jgi:Ethanolamine utilization protein EutJ (predicted chaperonin)